MLTSLLAAVAARCAAHDHDASISQGSLRRSISMGVNSDWRARAAIESLCGDKSSRSPLHSTSPRRSGIDGLGRAVHGQDVAVGDAGIAHALPMHAQQKIRARAKQRLIDRNFPLRCCPARSRHAGGDASIERQQRAARTSCDVPCNASRDAALSTRRRPRAMPGSSSR